MSEPPGHRFVFVGGLHRSGTSMVARALAQHPRASGLTGTDVPEDEGEHLQNVYVDSNDLGGVGRFAFSEKAHLTECSPLAGPRTYERLMEAWAPYWDLSAEVLIEKSPPNLLKTRYLQAVFPNAYFVIVMRHPVAVSAAHLKWRRKVLRWFAPHALMRHWVEAFELFARDARGLERLAVVRYEDFVADPAGELRRLHHFLGLPPHATDVDVSAGHNQRYIDLWGSHRANVVKHAYRRAIHLRYRDRVRRFGYVLDDAEPVEPLEAVLRRLGIDESHVLMMAP